VRLLGINYNVEKLLFLREEKISRDNHWEVESVRRDALLLFLVFILVVSASDQAAAPTGTETYEPLNFVLSQTEMPIYTLVTPEVNETFVQNLASSLFGIHDILAEETEGIYFVNWSNSYLEVDSKDGSSIGATAILRLIQRMGLSGFQIMIDSGISRRVMSFPMLLKVRQLLKHG